MAAGLLVVQRSHWFDEEQVLVRTSTPRRPTLALGSEEILHRFRGVEGRSWPEGLGKPPVPLGSDGLVATSFVEDVRRYFADVSSRQLCDLLFCEWLLGEQTAVPPESFSFCGYDISPGTSDLTCYSAVYNEVIYGLYSELREFSSHLNESLLVPTLEDVEALLVLRQRLGQEGADLEDNGRRDAAVVIAIHAVMRTEDPERRRHHK
jgi:hypothetical protein